MALVSPTGHIEGESSHKVQCKRLVEIRQRYLEAKKEIEDRMAEFRVSSRNAEGIGQEPAAHRRANLDAIHTSYVIRFSLSFDSQLQQSGLARPANSVEGRFWGELQRELPAAGC